MVVGDDKTVFIDEKSGTQATLFEVALLTIALKWTEEFVKWITVAATGVPEKMPEDRTAALDGFHRADINHTGPGCFGKFAKAFRS